MNLPVKILFSIALIAAAGGEADRAAAEAAAAEARRLRAQRPAVSKTRSPVKAASPTPATPAGTEQSPHWVCPEQAITVAPVWHGQQIECPFTIRNEGRSDLNIKAKGG